MARYASRTAQSGRRLKKGDTSNTNEAAFILKLHWHFCHFAIRLCFLNLIYWNHDKWFAVGKLTQVIMRV